MARAQMPGLAFWLGAAALGWVLYPSSDGVAEVAAPDEEAIDRIWREANRKYDKPRAGLVETVDRQAHNGPFRPDWTSLKGYRAPQWYEDAKFGIFIHWGL